MSIVIFASKSLSVCKYSTIYGYSHFNSPKNVSAAPPEDFPSEIIKGKLYLGGFKSAKSYEVVKDLGITHILNISDNCECVFENLQCKKIKETLK